MHRRRVYGPFSKSTGFPEARLAGFKGDILVGDAEQIYIRHKAFRPDLTVSNAPGPHILPTAGFLDGTPQHRTYWTVSTTYGWTRVGPPSGDMLVTDGRTFYEVQGFPVHRHSYFDPRKSGYTHH